MEKYAIKYKQYDQEFFSVVLSFREISDHSKVLVFGEDDYGYQRKVNALHLNRMVKTLKEGIEILSPTSILLGISPENIEILTHKNKDDLYMFDTSNIEKISEKFRIIDGQHRLAAFKKTLEEGSVSPELKDKLLNYQFNVIFAVIPDQDRTIEIDLFNSINSKAKPLKTDLIKLAKYNYDIIYKKTDINYIDHLIARIVYKLNSTTSSVWNNAIKVDVNSSNPIGSISFTAFAGSIEKVVKVYFDRNSQDDLNLKEFKEIDEILNKLAENFIIEIINPIWEEIHTKWGLCFKKAEKFVSNEGYTIWYDDNFYLQLPMGVKALHGKLTQNIEKNPQLEIAIDEFKKWIAKSPISSSDWEKGKAFKGLSSEAGYKIIRNMISGEDL